MTPHNRHPAGRPARRGSKRQHPPRPTASPPAPAAAPTRRLLEVYSVGALATFHRLPRLVVPGMLGVLLLLGLALPFRWAGVFVLLVAAFLGWLLALSWPVLDARGRAVRTLVVLGVAVVGAARLLGLF